MRVVGAAAVLAVTVVAALVSQDAKPARPLHARRIYEYPDRVVVAPPGAVAADGQTLVLFGAIDRAGAP